MTQPLSSTPASTLPLPVSQPENKSCGITSIALPIIAALAGFVFLPFEIAIVLTGVVAIGALLCSGCIDPESVKKVGTLIPRWSEREPGRILWPSAEQKTSTQGRSSGPMPREHEPVDHGSLSSSSSRDRPGYHSGSAYERIPTPSMGVPEREPVDGTDPSRLRTTPPMRHASQPAMDLYGNYQTPRVPHAPHASRNLGSSAPGGPEREEIGS